MPELPEVETVRRGLLPVLGGAELARVELRRDGLRWPFPPRMAERLGGVRVEALRRRAKVLLADLSSGETLLVHLGMSGRILIDAAMPGGFYHDVPAGKHDHVIFHLRGGGRITYNDARRFGAMDLWPTADLAAHPMLAKLGPEPLGNAFSGPVLAERIRGKASPIKAALLDQRVVAGLGNIYVCEALWRAQISPRRKAGNIGAARAEALAGHIRETLEEAIEAGGSSLKDYRQADGELGYFQHAFKAYDREGTPCAHAGCSGEIRRIVQSGRSTFYCGACQR